MLSVLLGLQRMVGFGRMIQGACFFVYSSNMLLTTVEKLSSLLPLGRKLKTKDARERERPLSVHLSKDETGPEGVCPTQTTQQSRGRVCTAWPAGQPSLSTLPPTSQPYKMFKSKPRVYS